MFALLTDEALVAKFPLNERKAIKEHVPWTRVVKAGRSTTSSRYVVLPAFTTRVHGTCSCLLYTSRCV